MQVHVSKDPNDLSYEAAGWMTTLIETTLYQQDRFCLLLSGGNTPKNLYKLLAEDSFKKRIDWARLHIFFGDERTVPFSDERNNGKMAYPLKPNQTKDLTPKIFEEPAKPKNL